MIDQYFPWHYLVGEHLQAKQLPLWNPYQYGGYPMHGDPQSGAWYPMVWILSLLCGGYSIYTLHLDFIITLYLAAVGFYKLSQHFNYTSLTSVLLAYMYCCSGFFIGNAQHYTWIVSAAYIPFILLYYLKTLQKPNVTDALKTSLFLFLLLSGGYPAFLIILSYILFGFLMLRLYNAFQESNIRLLLKLLYYQLIIGFFFICNSSVVIYSITYCKPYITRGEGVSLTAALSNPFSIPSFISFLFPFATAQHGELLGTDISMANAYIGMMGISLFVMSLFRTHKTPLYHCFLTIGLLSLALSVGDVLPFRKLSYDYLPLMNLFRFPSAFRLFFILSFLLLAGYELNDLLSGKVVLKKVVGMYTLLCSIIAVALCISIWKNYSGTHVLDYFTQYLFFKTHATWYDHILVQGSIQLFILGVMALLWISTHHRKNIFKWIITCLILIDVFIAVQLNMNYTVVSLTSNPIAIKAMLDQYPKGFPIPSRPINQNNDEGEDLKPLWKNLNIFKKEIAYDGYNPFFLSSYETLEESIRYSSSKNNKPIFLAKKISTIDNTTDTALIQSQDIFINPKDNSLYKDQTVHTHASDTCFISSFQGNRIDLKAKCKEPGLAVIFQNNFPGWKATELHSPKTILTANYSLMAIPLNKGEQSIKLNYMPKHLIVFFTLSVSSLAVVLLYLFLGLFYSKKEWWNRFGM